MTCEVVLIGNPENRRITMFRDAIARANGPQVVVISWLQLIDSDGNALRECLAPSKMLAVRIDTPGENVDVERRLIQRGAELRADAGDQFPPATMMETGRILAPHLWQSGFADWLARLRKIIDRSAVPVLNHPEEISLCLDKPRCQEHLERSGIPVAERLPEFHSAAEFLSLMQSRRWNRAFIKLRAGSSASGVLAVDRSSTALKITTSVETAERDGQLQLYNSLRIRRYHDADAAAVIDALIPLDVYAERWVPKGTIAGRTFDLRVVTIGGRARHVVVRTSRSPLTNLHLGNARGDVAGVQSRIGADAWANIMQVAESVAEAFPQSHVLGIDIGLRPRTWRPTIFEVNAFGDLLPNVSHEGEQVYEAIWNSWRSTLEC